MEETLNDFAKNDTKTRRFFMAGAVFNEKDKYMPVPQGQIDMQPGVLVQRPEYK